MEFLYPNTFFLLIFPLILFLFLLLKKQNSFQKYFEKEVLDKITVSNNFINQNIKNSLLVLALLLLIIAAARPVMDKKEHKIKESLIPIIIAIDVSKSMLANDIYPNRLEMAKQKLLKIIKNSKQSALGVVLFAKSAFVLSPITQDFTSLTFLVDNLDRGLNFDNGSNVLAMLEASADLLEDFNSKNIILLSDGGNKKDYSKEIEFAKTNNIKIYAIGLATNKQSPIPTKEGYMTNSSGQIVTVGLNKSIAKLAVESAGGYIDFSLGERDINEILRDISYEAKKEQMNSTKIKTYKELFYYPLALCLLFLFMSFSTFSFRTKKNMVAGLVLIALSNAPLEAGVLDFKTLDEAKTSYEKSDFIQAEKSYKKVNKNAQTQYNMANSLYKQGKYKEALNAYKDIKSEDKNLQYQSLHNMGNAYVKQNDLQNAKTMYEKALKLKDDEQTKQNLQTVKQALKQQKKQDQKNKKDKKNKKDDKNKDNKEKKDKKNQDKKSDKKEKNDKKEKDSKKKKEDKKESKDDKSKTKEASKEKKEKEKEKSKEKKKPSQQEASQQIKKQQEISDMEEKKWLNKVKNQKNKTFLRRVESKSKEDNIQNPW